MPEINDWSTKLTAGRGEEEVERGLRRAGPLRTDPRRSTNDRGLPWLYLAIAVYTIGAWAVIAALTWLIVS